MPRSTHETIILPVVRHLQEESWSCGTAALKIVLDSVGWPARERELIDLCGAAPHHGTPPWALASGLELLGVAHEVVESATIGAIEARIRSLQLCIVDYQSWGRRGRDYRRGRTGHYSVVFGYDPTHLLLADPAKGKHKPDRGSWGTRSIRKDLFDGRWHDRAANGTPTRRWMLCVPFSQRDRARPPVSPGTNLDAAR